MTIEHLNRIAAISKARKALGHIQTWDITLCLNEAAQWCLVLREWSGGEPLINEPVSDKAVMKLYKLIVDYGMKHIGGLAVVQSVNCDALEKAHQALEVLGAIQGL